jgi:hypothetical protein
MERIKICFHPQLRNVEEAFAYGQRHDTGDCSSSNVWTILFRLLIQPPDGPMLRAMNLPKNLLPYQPDLPSALRLLHERRDQVDSSIGLPLWLCGKVVKMRK